VPLGAPPSQDRRAGAKEFLTRVLPRVVALLVVKPSDNTFLFLHGRIPAVEKYLPPSCPWWLAGYP